MDAAELVGVEYAETPAVIDVREALKPGAPQLHPEAPNNLAIDWPGMVDSPENEREVDQIIKSAPHVARVTVRNQRMAVASMETRGATGVYDAKSESLHALRLLAERRHRPQPGGADPRGRAHDKLRVITEDVGGAFGMKTPVYPEYLALLVAAKKTGRPVHWMSTRSEAFMTDTQARDTYTETELALDEKGKFLALRMKHLCGQGAYVTPAGIGINTNNVARCLPGMYRIPKIDFSSRCVFTNAAPIGPYRGAGRPEANYALDRAVEEAARVTGIDTVQLRRKNLIPPSSMPYKTAVTTTYDSGDFPGDVRQGARAERLQEFQQAQARGGAAQEAARHRHLLHARTRRRAADRERVIELPGRRHTGDGAQRAIDRAKPRHRVRPPAGGPSRHRPQRPSSTGTAIPRARSSASPRSARARPWRPATPSSRPRT